MAARNTGNSLLDALPLQSFSRLKPHLTVVDITLREEIHEPGEQLEHVLFPTRGLISVVASMEDGAAVEINMIGREGMFSVAALLGDDRPSQRAMVQLAGHALRMKADLFRQAVEDDLAMRPLLLRYTTASCQPSVKRPRATGCTCWSSAVPAGCSPRGIARSTIHSR
jgi:CRP-like cAMP-binding protein